MNDWNIKDWFLFWVFAGVMCLCGLLGGCASRGVAGDLADVIARDSLLRGRLEETVESLDGAISDSRGRIGAVIEDSREIADGAARIDRLFTCYEREVERLIDEMRGASDKIKDSVESYLVTGRDARGSGARGGGGAVAGADEED